VTHLSNVSFDAATFEIWGALLHGASLLVVSAETLLAPRQMSTLLREQAITTMFLTTAWFNRLASADASMFSPLDDLLIGGQALSPAPVQAVLQAGAPRCLRNAYGPTESTTFALTHPVDTQTPLAASIPVGRPIGNTTAHVLDHRLAPVPVGVTGELWLGGDGLARGYLNDRALTAERFVPDPFRNDGSRLYRTGDLARYLPDGSIDYLGRADHQIKLRGYRIEPAEVEAALNAHPAVRAAHVGVHAPGTESAELVAWVVSATPERAAHTDALRQHLAERLPRYLVPGIFMWLNELPLTPNGKTDTRALPTPRPAPLEVDPDLAQGSTAQRVAALWRAVLGDVSLQWHDNFFDLGGHSMRLVQLQQRLESEFSRSVPIVELFRHPTVAAQATYLDAVEPAPLAPQGAATARQAAQQRRQSLRDRRGPRPSPQDTQVGDKP